MTTDHREVPRRNLQGAASPRAASPRAGSRRMRLVEKVWSKASAFVGSAFVAGMAAAFLGAWATTRLAAAIPTLTNHAPLASIETQRQANDEQGIPDTFASQAELARLGVAVQARFTVAGLSGTQTITVTCRVYAADAPSSWYASRSFDFTVRNGTQVTSPCWIPLPRSRRARHYNALTVVSGPHWTTAPALLPVSFVAPPTAR